MWGEARGQRCPKTGRLRSCCASDILTCPLPTNLHVLGLALEFPVRVWKQKLGDRTVWNFGLTSISMDLWVVGRV